MTTRRRRRVARAGAGVALIVAAVLVAVLGTRPSLSVVETPLVGKPAPQLDGPRIAGKGTVRLSSYSGRWVLVNFFASWCTACQSEAPELEKFRYSRPDGIRPVVIGVLYGDTRADGVEFQRSEGENWPTAYDPSGTIASAWGVGSLPRSYLVAPDRRIVASVFGGVTSSGLDRLLEKKYAAEAVKHE